MKFLLGSLCAAALVMPLTLTANAAPANDAIPHCGKCEKGKCKKDGCKDGCKCKKECKEGCECKKCEEKEDA